MKKSKKYQITITKDSSNFDPSKSWPEPIIELWTDDMRASYYYDLSGEILVDAIIGELTFFSDSGKMRHQIDDLRKEIVKQEKELVQHIKSMKLALVAMEAGLKAAKKFVKDNKKSPAPKKAKEHRTDCVCKSCMGM